MVKEKVLRVCCVTIRNRRKESEGKRMERKERKEGGEVEERRERGREV